MIDRAGMIDVDVIRHIQIQIIRYIVSKVQILAAKADERQQELEQEDGSAQDGGD